MMDREAGDYGIEPTQRREWPIEIVFDDGNPRLAPEGVPQHLEHCRRKI
jgi:hypothetical protein